MMPFLDLIAEIFGYIALAFGVASFQVKDTKKTLFIMSGMSFFWILHMGLLGYAAGALASTCIFLRNLCGAFLSQKIMKRSTVIFFLCGAAIVFYQFSNWYDFIAVIALFFTSLAVFSREHPLLLRCSFLCGDSSWLIYAFLVGSPPMMIASLAFMSSSIIALVRFNLIPFLKARNISIF